MVLKKYKPITPARRWITGEDFFNITETSPEKSLLRPNKKTGGRNNSGRVTMRRRGGGHKRRYRIIDFKRKKKDVFAEVISIAYDPNRSARIALLSYEDSEKTYILAPEGLNIGDKVIASEKAEIKVGNALPIAKVPLGGMVHNVELVPGKGGQIIRAAGSYAQVMAKEGKHAHVKLPSGEIRLIRQDCWATIGQVGNIEHEDISIGKAGRTRWLGRRPKVRGVAMNPVDHPMGGGEGKTSGGRHPCSPWGTPAKGYKTRKKRKASNVYILKKRGE